MAVDEQRQTEHDRLEAWRLEQLIRAGYNLHRAEQLAADPTVDLHEAIDLLAAGCPERTALRILLS